jgi:hypothetical protein
VGAARFWGWRLVGEAWERVGGGLDINPGGIIAEMRRRA